MSFSILKTIMGQSVSEPEAEASAKKLVSDNEKVVPEPDTSSSAVSTESDTLEWKFTDLRKVEGCLIHEVDAVMLKRFIGHNVTVTNLSRERFHGCCLAIDPVTLSVILAKRIPGNTIRVITLPGYHLAKISVDRNCVPVEEQVSVNDLDAAELYHSQTLYSERISKNATRSTNSDPRENGNSQNTNSETHSRIHQSQSQQNPQITYTEDELKSRKELVMNMLRKHRMPVTENGNVLEMPGGVKISPPYTIESCDTKGNQVIKNKLGEMLTIECFSN